MSDNKNKLNIKKIIITVLLLLIVIIAGTYAWYSYQTNKTAMVLTVGEINNIRVTLSPYQINTTLSPTTSYSSQEYTQVTSVNNSSTTGKITLYYQINSIDSALISSYLKYTVEKSTNGTSYSKYSEGNFSTAKDGGTLTIFSSESIPSNTTYYYRVYIWIDGSSGSQSSMQGKVLDAELRASIL